jgi:outer membrane protein TolC
MPPPPEQPGQSGPLALDEAIRIALSNSGVVRVLGGGAPSVAATPYDPAIAEARVRSALAAFDAGLTSSVYSNWIKRPPEALFGPGLAEPTERDEAGVTLNVTKPWLTGAESRVGYNPPLNYLYIPDADPDAFNPLYTSNIEFALRQPLLKGFGVAVNKAPIRIAQLRRDQVALETRQAVMASVRSVAEAYWELHAAREAAAAIEQVVPLLERVVQIEEERMAAQRSVRVDVAKAQSQLRAVRQQAYEARAAIVQSELRLRNLLGLLPTDGYQVIPSSRPLEAPVQIDLSASLATAQEQRPDLARQQLAVRTRETELLVARNAGLAQVDAVGLYRWTGTGEDVGSSMDQMFRTYFHDWQAGITVSVPIGRRAGAAGVRAATLQLARERALMQQALHAANHQITSLMEEAAYAHQLFVEADARLRANTEWLEGAKIRYENPPPSGDDWLLAATNDYLTALRSQADAAADAQAFLARYNTALARLQEATGTILNDNGVEWDCGEE